MIDSVLMGNIFNWSIISRISVKIVMQFQCCCVTINPSPVIATVPSSGPVGTPVTTGSGFTGTLMLHLTELLVFTVVNDGQITTTVPGSYNRKS
jgi:hypothetical protein